MSVTGKVKEARDDSKDILQSLTPAERDPTQRAVPFAYTSCCTPKQRQALGVTRREPLLLAPRLLRTPETSMNGMIKSALCAALLLSGGQAIAADQMSSTSPSHSQLMKDCMAKQKAKDSTMSKDDMKKTCKAELTGANSLGGVSTSSPTTPTTKGSPAPSTGNTTTPPPK
jgi:hypothetical protein